MGDKKKKSSTRLIRPEFMEAWVAASLRAYTQIPRRYRIIHGEEKECDLRVVGKTGEPQIVQKFERAAFLPIDNKVTGQIYARQVDIAEDLLKVLLRPDHNILKIKKEDEGKWSLKKQGVFVGFDARMPEKLGRKFINMNAREIDMILLSIAAKYGNDWISVAVVDGYRAVCKDWKVDKVIVNQKALDNEAKESKEQQDERVKKAQGKNEETYPEGLSSDQICKKLKEKGFGSASEIIQQKKSSMSRTLASQRLLELVERVSDSLYFYNIEPEAIEKLKNHLICFIEDDVTGEKVTLFAPLLYESALEAGLITQEGKRLIIKSTEPYNTALNKACDNILKTLESEILVAQNKHTPIERHHHRGTRDLPHPAA